MIIFILILILIAVLYSTENGRDLLGWVVWLPVRIVLYPFDLLSKIKEKRAELIISKKAEEFKNGFKHQDLELIIEEYLDPELDITNSIFEQISIYRKFENGEIDLIYLREDLLRSNEGDNSLSLIKPEKINDLRNKLNIIKE